MRLRVDDRVRIDAELAVALGKDQVDALKALCTHPNPALKEWRRHRRGHAPSEFVKSWRREKGGGVSFPQGREDEILRILGWPNSGIEVEEGTVSAPAPTFEWTGPPPWPHQTRLVDSYLAGGARIWRSPPGSGKTSTALQLFARLGQRTLVVAPRDAIFVQWVDRARELFGFEPGVIKGQERELGPPLVVASQRTLWQSPELVAEIAPTFGLVVFDEAQLCGSRSYQDVVDRFPAFYRLAVSGDEHRADGLECLVYDQFGPEVETVERAELVERGELVDVEIRIVLSGYRAPWYVDLPPELETRDAKERGRRLAQHRFENRHRLLAEMAADEARNRLVAAAALGSIREGQQVAVLSAVREHCLRLEALLTAAGVSTVRLMGDDRDFEACRARFARGDARAAVGTFGKVGVGFESHRELARGVIAMPIASRQEGKMQARQFAGRFARSAPGKSAAVVRYVHDPLVYGDEPVRRLKGWFENVTVEVDGRVESAASWLKRKRAKTTPTTERSEPAARRPASGKQPGFWDTDE